MFKTNTLETEGSHPVDKHFPVSLSKLLNPYQVQRHTDVPVEGSKHKIVSVLIMVTFKGGTYRFACGGDLYRLVKFWQDSLLHFAFPEPRRWIGLALRDLDQIGLLLCHSSMYAPSCMTWTVPEALGNMDNCQAGNRLHSQQREIKSSHWIWKTIVVWFRVIKLGRGRCGVWPRFQNQ